VSQDFKTGDWKVARTRRLESLRYKEDFPNKPFDASLFARVEFEFLKKHKRIINYEWISI
jgi:hypothetical protein